MGRGTMDVTLRPAITPPVVTSPPHRGDGGTLTLPGRRAPGDRPSSRPKSTNLGVHPSMASHLFPTHPLEPNRRNHRPAPNPSRPHRLDRPPEPDAPRTRTHATCAPPIRAGEWLALKSPAARPDAEERTTPSPSRGPRAAATLALVDALTVDSPVLCTPKPTSQTAARPAGAGRAGCSRQRGSSPRLMDARQRWDCLHPVSWTGSGPRERERDMLMGPTSSLPTHINSCWSAFTPPRPVTVTSLTVVPLPQRVLDQRPHVGRQLHPRPADRKGLLWKGVPGDAQAHQWLQGKHPVRLEAPAADRCRRSSSSRPTKTTRTSPARYTTTASLSIPTLRGCTRSL